MPRSPWCLLCFRRALGPSSVKWGPIDLAELCGSAIRPVKLAQVWQARCWTKLLLPIPFFSCLAQKVTGRTFLSALTRIVKLKQWTAAALLPRNDTARDRLSGWPPESTHSFYDVLVTGTGLASLGSGRKEVVVVNPVVCWGIFLSPQALRPGTAEPK